MGDGKSVLFWTDSWNNAPLSQQFPDLFSYTKSIHITVNSLTNMEDLEDHFHTPISVQAFQQYEEMQHNITENALSHSHDQWIYLWGEFFLQ
jgi:hypothetical protein